MFGFCEVPVVILANELGCNMELNFDLGQIDDPRGQRPAIQGGLALIFGLSQNGKHRFSALIRFDPF